jgi:hypothetical protein
MHAPNLRAGHEDWRRERRGGGRSSTAWHAPYLFAGRAAVRHCVWLDKYIGMHLFQSLDASPFAPREYSHRRMLRGQAVKGMINDCK